MDEERRNEDGEGEQGGPGNPNGQRDGGGCAFGVADSAIPPPPGDASGAQGRRNMDEEEFEVDYDVERKIIEEETDKGCREPFGKGALA